MQWNAQQARALKLVDAWLKNPRGPQIFRLFGFAGTGKTTLAKHLAESVNGVVLFGAFTGKAALVLRQRGCPGAATLHSLAYITRDRSKSRLSKLEEELATELHMIAMDFADSSREDIKRAQDANKVVQELRTKIEQETNGAGRPMFSLNPESPIKGASLLVVDECSMVDETMGADLTSFGTKILVLGDPAQLPPVMGGGYFTEGVEPDVMLTDIQRQAKDSPIIRLATMIREERLPNLGRVGDVIVTDQADPEDVMRADQVLVGRNATRYASNVKIRSLLGRDHWMPAADDKLVCLRNNSELGLLNGALWRTTQEAQEAGGELLLQVVPDEGGAPLDVLAHPHYFDGRGEELQWWQRKEAQEFDYGYALTVHKSQGSQWDRVVLFNEGDAFRQHRWRWLYTGVTRASKALTLVML